MKKILIAIIASCLMWNICPAQNYEVIENELQEILNKRNGELTDISIIFKSQINSRDLSQKTVATSDKSLQREIAISELKDFSVVRQADVMSMLRAEEKSGNVTDINALWIVNAISCKATKDVIYTLSTHPDIKVISSNKAIQIISPKEMAIMQDAPANQFRGPASHILAVNADDVWSQGYTGKNVIVAVLDSGTNFYHHDLRNNLWTGVIDGKEVYGANFVDDVDTDEFGHGTHCAGIVCGDGTSGTTTGVAPDARLMTVKVVGKAGTGSVTQMLNGIQFALENGADIISMSLGFKHSTLTQDKKETIRSTFDNVLSAGVIVCAAAGNDGTSIGTPYNVDYPAACPSPWSHPDQTLKGKLSSVICVGADDLIGQSSQGPSTWEDTKYNEYQYNNGESMGLIRPDISAPGYYIYSLNNNQIDKYKIMSGTSQSTPCVAGVIALMLEKNPDLTPAQICEIIETTASNKPEKKNNVVGSGRIDALAAVNAVTAKNKDAYFELVSFSPESASQSNGVTVNITMKNKGKGNSSAQTTATLKTNSPYVTIISEETTTIGTLNANASITLNYTIDIAASTPNNHNIPFTINVTDGTLSWNDNFDIYVSTLPEIVLKSATPSGINANEQTELTVTMHNKGNAAMPVNTNLKLITTDKAYEYVNFIKKEASISPLGANETATASFIVKASEETPHNTSLDFFIETSSNVENKTNVIYEFENDFEGWTTFDQRVSNYYNPFFHSNEAFSHGKTPKDSHSGKGHLMSETRYHSIDIDIYNHLDNYLVSPKIKVDTDSKISFWARPHHSNYYKEHFGVAVSTKNNNDANDFTIIEEWTITKSQGTAWKQFTVDLGAYAGKEIYVAIRHFFTQKQWDNLDHGYYVDALNIDDIEFHNIYVNYNHIPSLDLNDPTHFEVIVTNTIDLPAPTGLTAIADNYNKVDLTWNAVARATSYNIYRNDEKIATVGKETTSYADNNIKHNTTYCYKVAAVYAGVEYEHSEESCATTEKKDYSADVRFSPQTIEVDGETNVVMNLTIINDGKKEFKARASYTLKCNDYTYLTITNNTGNIKLLQPDEEVNVTATVKISNDIPDNYVINFNLNLLSLVTDPSQPEYFTFDIPFEVPVSNPLRAPKNVTAKNIGANSVTLGWDAASKATSYNIYRDGLLIANTSSTMYYNYNLEKETTYCYEVTSVTENEESEVSEKICVTTLAEDKGILVQSYELIEQGTTTIIRATLINQSDEATAETTKATLTCEDEYITIVNGTSSIGSIAVGETTTINFTINISHSVPSDHNVAFNVVVETESEDIGNLEYTFDSGFDGWTNYIWAANSTWKWEYESSKQCISSYSYKNGNRTPNNLICSPIKVKVSENTQVIWDVASSSSGNYYAEHYAVYLTSVDPVSTYGWETLPSPIFEKTLTSEYAGSNFKTETASASSETGNEVWVVFHHHDCKNQNSILVDNIKITNVLVPSPVYYYNIINITANPPAPVELTATADGANTVYLSWNEVANAEYYNIYRDGEYLTNTTSTLYSDNNLTHNTTYCYEVTAVYEGSEYAHSGDVCVTTTKKDYNVEVEFSTQTIDIEGETTAAICFTVLNDGKYDFEASYTLTCEDNTYVSIANNTNYISVSPEEEVAMTIYVTISENVPDDYVFEFNLNLHSLVTDSSQPGYFTFDFSFEVVANNPLRIPENLTITDIGQYFIALEWDTAIGAASYNIYRDSEFIANTHETNYLDENLNPETRYCYTVTNATNNAESDFSEEVCATTLEEEKGILVQSYDLSASSGQATLTVILINRSEAATTATTTATISCNDQYVTIVNATDLIGSFAVGEIAMAEFSVILDENIPSGYNIDFGIAVEYESDGGGYTTVDCAFGSDLSGCTTLTKDDHDHNWYHSNEQGAHGYNKQYGTSNEQMGTTPSGMGFVFSESYCNVSDNGFNPDHLIILPKQVVPSATTKVEFYACSMSSTARYADETFGVFVSTTNNTSIDSFEEVSKWTLDSSQASLKMAKKTADLSKYEGCKVWVAIRHYGSGDNAALAIDDITVNNVKVSSTVTYEKTFTVTVNKSNAFNIYNGTGSWTDASKWSFGSIPTASDNVVINGNVTIESGAVIVESLTINDGSLTVDTGVMLTVNGMMTNTDVTSLLINDGAQLFINNDNVAATFKMAIINPGVWSSANNDGWQFISSPFINTDISDFTETDVYDLYKYDGSNDAEWRNQKFADNNFEEKFISGQGYLASYQEEDFAYLKGNLNNATTFEYKANYVNQDVTNLANFHLLGNPFPFNMDMTKAEYNNLVAGVAIVNKDGGYTYVGTGKEQNIIPVGDGFFVKATADDASFSYNANAKRSRGVDANSINIIVSGKAGNDNVIVNFAGKSEGFDKLQNFNDEIATVYVAENGKHYGIYNCEEDVQEIELAFEAKEMGNYTIAIEPNGKFQSVTLVDRFTGVETNMLLDDYHFTATSGNNTNRFVIRLANGQEPTANSQFVYQSGEELILSVEGSVQIVDVMGRVVYNNEVVSDNNRIDVSSFNNGTYIVRVINEEGVKVQKVVIY